MNPNRNALQIEIDGCLQSLVQKEENAILNGNVAVAGNFSGSTTFDVALEYDNSDVVVFDGNDGSYISKMSLSTTYTSILAADVNGDEIDDIIVLNTDDDIFVCNVAFCAKISTASALRARASSSDFLTYQIFTPS